MTSLKTFGCDMEIFTMVQGLLQDMKPVQGGGNTYVTLVLPLNMANELQILRLRVHIFICACMKWSLFCIRIFLAVFVLVYLWDSVGASWE